MQWLLILLRSSLHVTGDGEGGSGATVVLKEHDKTRDDLDPDLP